MLHEIILTCSGEPCRHTLRFSYRGECDDALNMLLQHGMMYYDPNPRSHQSILMKKLF